jgi:hypothetical protein
MTGWLLIIFAALGGNVGGTMTSQVGPFATEAACQTAMRAANQFLATYSYYGHKTVCVPQ